MAEIGYSSFVHLILNPAAGTAAAYLDELTKTAHEGGIRLRVLEPGEDARPAALEAVGGGAHTLGIAGGDGSVAVAGVPLEHEAPLGTLNHFARDLGFDLAHPLSALEAFDSGREQRVDVGNVNGRPFINNVSLGLYAQMLADPGYRQDKLGVAQAKIKAAFSDPELWRALRIDPPEEEPPEGVLAMVVSNNPYELSPSFSLGQRHRLDVGTLQVLVLGADTLEELDRLLEGTLRGAIEFRPALRNWTSEHLEMGVLGESVRVGVDGEPISLEAPLASRSSPVRFACSCPKDCPRTGGCRHQWPDCIQPEPCVSGCTQPWLRKRVEAMIPTAGWPRRAKYALRPLPRPRRVTQPSRPGGVVSCCRVPGHPRSRIGRERWDDLRRPGAFPGWPSGTRDELEAGRAAGVCLGAIRRSVKAFGGNVSTRVTACEDRKKADDPE